MLFSTVNMNTPDGLGIVEEKNQLLLADTLADMLTAVRHGNGRDWWVVAPKDKSNRYFLWRLTPGGIIGPEIRQSGTAWNAKDWSGQAVFSPDGTRYARANPYNGLHVFDFDRCTGTFSHPRSIPLNSDSVGACGVAFSPNSRYLYLSTGLQLFQFDMEAPNLLLSKKLIGTYDGYVAPFPTTFYQQMLAPDGKIYMTCTNGNHIMHVIHQPNKNGVSCNFEQHGLGLPAHISWTTPNFPHFRLYDWAGSPCDTLGLNGGPVSAGEPSAGSAAQLALWPNPAVEAFTAAAAAPLGGWVLSNSLGQVVREGQGGQPVVRVDVQGLPAGVYYFCAAGYRAVKLAVAD